MDVAEVHLPYYCIVNEGYNHCWHFYRRHSQLTHILKWKKKRRRCEGEKEECLREKEKETKTDRPTGWDWVSGTERMEESRWYRQRNEQVIEVKWEWEQERKKRRGNLREIKHGLCATEVRRQTSMLWQPAGTSPADRLCCFPICSEERHSPTWGHVKASR